MHINYRATKMGCALLWDHIDFNVSICTLAIYIRQVEIAAQQYSTNRARSFVNGLQYSFQVALTPQLRLCALLRDYVVTILLFFITPAHMN